MPKGTVYFYHKTQLPIVIDLCMLNNDYTYSFSLRKMNLKSTSKHIEELFFEIDANFNSILKNLLNNISGFIRNGIEKFINNN